jgi:hypothetical protein
MVKRLEPIDYLETLLHEYDSLQDEIRSRTNIRYGVIAAFTVGIIGTLKMLFSAGTGLTIQENLLNYFIFLFFIPSLWFIAMTLQIIMIIQIERLGKAIVLIEYKVEALIQEMGCPELKPFRTKIDNFLKDRLTYKTEIKKEEIDKYQFSLGAPMVWQRLLISRKKYWDWKWFKIFFPLLLPVLLSSVGVFLLDAKLLCWPTERSALIIIFYVFVAGIISYITSRKKAFGGIEDIVLP